MLAIEVKNLTKEFNSLKAVDNISFEVEEGEIFGLLGPNGAGKTTTIKMLSTLMGPTKGEAKIFGYHILKQKDEVRKIIGIVFQEPALDTQLTGYENLDFHARLYGLDSETRNKRIKEVLELVELWGKENILVKNYSGGMKRRLEIARGLMHFPKVLFLDEPTLGLDPQTRRRIWEYILTLNKKEKITIILTTHYMEEADFLSQKIGIIDQGRIIALDNPYNLKNFLGGDILSLEMDFPKKGLKVFRKIPWVKKIKITGNILQLNVREGEKKIPAIIKISEQSKQFTIRAISLRKPTLEDVFLHFTGKTIREEETTSGRKLKKIRYRF